MFDIAILSPFKSKADKYPGCNSDKAMALYQAIDWVALYREIEESGDSPESPFYYYEIARKNNLGEKEELCISGCMNSTVGIGYMRPKMERKGWFIKKDVLNPNFSTQMDGMDTAFALSCLEAFIRGNSNYLEQNLYNKEEY